MTRSTTILSIAVLVLFGIVIFQQCKRQKITDPVKIDTSAPRIIYVQQPLQQAPVTQPQPIIIQSPGTQGSQIIIPPQYQQPSTDMAELTKQVKELAAAFYTSRIYRDTLTLRDSTGQRVGVFNYNDSVSQNAIQQRAPSYRLNFPHTYTTVTITTPAERKRQLYGLIGVNGSQAALVQSLEIGALYKDRQDRVYIGKAGIGLDGKPFFGIGRAFKIKLRK